MMCGEAIAFSRSKLKVRIFRGRQQDGHQHKKSALKEDSCTERGQRTLNMRRAQSEVWEVLSAP